MENKLHFVLVGCKKEGMSAAGNYILTNNVFSLSSGNSSQTTEVDTGINQFQNYSLLVVDQPGLENTNTNNVENRMVAVQSMERALMLCPEGIDAFLLVIKFSNGVTQEYMSILQDLNKLFGPTFFSHVIVIITYGDLFQSEVKEGISFHDWCKSQVGIFRQLYETCEGRFLLFNNNEDNMEKKRGQLLKLVQFTLNLRNMYGKYTRQCFKDCEIERLKIIIELKASTMPSTIEQKIKNLLALLGKGKKVRPKIQELKNETNNPEISESESENLLEIIKALENCMNEIKLQSWGKHMERIEDVKSFFRDYVVHAIEIACTAIVTKVPGLLKLFALIPLLVYGLVRLGLFIAEKIIKKFQERSMRQNALCFSQK